MKKSYCVLALATCICLSASAIEKVSSIDRGTAVMQTASEFTVSGSYNAASAKAPAKAATMKQLTGYFTTEFESMFVDDEGNPKAPEPTQVYIEEIGANQVSLTFHPWSDYSNVNLQPVIGDVNLAAGTITIKTSANQFLGSADFKDGSVQLEWRAFQIAQDPSDPTKTIKNDIDIVGTLRADGTIAFGDEYSFCGFGVSGQPTSWLYGFNNLVLTAPDYFEYVASEWKPAGECTFQDWVMNPVFKEEYQAAPCQVPFLVNQSNNNLILLQKPYSMGGWAQLNERAGSEGFLYIDKRVDNLVCLRPFVESGFWLDFGDASASDVQQMYIYNQEATFVYVEGNSPEDVAAVYEEEGIAASTYDPATKVIDIISCYFGQTTNPLGGYSWNGVPKQWLKITLPESYVGAVEGIEADDVNAPKTYYNLQGVKVANPVAGEIVIVKQGGKTYKTIAK